MVVIDIDRFKQVNDFVGIAVGDSILLTIARRLARLLKPQDTLARLTGDQFAFLLSEKRAGAHRRLRRIGAQDAARADHLRREGDLPHRLDRHRHARRQAAEAEEILKDAEIGMYHAKRLGGDRIEAFRPALRPRGTDLLTLESELRRALDREEIKVLYQPIVRLEDQSIAGFEALVRWDHPKLGRISPSDFIPHRRADRADHRARPLRARAHRAPARRLAGSARPREPLFASVNVSSRQLLRHDLINDVKSVLVRSQLARGSLKLEVTESAGDGESGICGAGADAHARARRRPCRSTISAPATRRSSYLQRFPFDTIKIDQTFVRGNGDGDRPVILRSIIALAHDLGMDVVAEGAESEADALELYQLGCEYVQGFLYGEPMTAEAAKQLLLQDQLETAR